MVRNIFRRPAAADGRAAAQACGGVDEPRRRPVNQIVRDHIEEPKFRIAAALEAIGERTTMTFRQVFESADAFEIVEPFAIPGGQQTFDKFAKRLAAMAR